MDGPIKMCFNRVLDKRTTVMLIRFWSPPLAYSFTYFINSYDKVLLKCTVLEGIRTNLCVTSRWRVSCRCEGTMTDHQRPWSEAACRPPSPLHKQTGGKNTENCEINKELQQLSEKELHLC